LGPASGAHWHSKANVGFGAKSSEWYAEELCPFTKALAGSELAFVFLAYSVTSCLLHKDSFEEAFRAVYS